ncbi:MAG TPA: A/G-specific adenine glycosylase [Acidobacteriaceae bacterium]|nr:A/G-specific adenine glycosylase [Acidobacteriaceae bacterium]
MNSVGLRTTQLRNFRQALLWWYSLHARDLPWRRTRDPYQIWVSEVMLQQTRVATVVDRYRTFIASFPTLVALALAEEDEVLTQWSGLGYYKRARELRHAAQVVMREHAGSMPQKFDELRRLPGIGQYSAAAIASIAFGEPVAVVDGNVERVITRVLGATESAQLSTRARMRDAAQKLLDKDQPGTFNQAMMELGATVCHPRWPRCDKCPVQEICRTQGEHPRPPRAKILSRQAAYGLVRRLVGQSKTVEVLVQRRPADASQMPGMWELPEVDMSIVENMEPVLRLSHAITNTAYYVTVYALRELPGEKLEPHSTQEWANAEKLLKIPLTGLARKVLMRMDILPRPKSIRTGIKIPDALDPFVPNLNAKGNPRKKEHGKEEQGKQEQER